MTYRSWIRLLTFTAVLSSMACGSEDSSGPDTAEGGAGGESGASAQPLTLSIGDAAVVEGDTGGEELTFTVTLSEASAEVVKVAYKTEDDTALAEGVVSQGGGDYNSKSATLRFDPGETKQTFTVDANGDTLGEADETFRVLLSKPVGASIEDGEALGTIENDDEAPEISIADASVSEGNAGTSNVNLVVSLSEPSTIPVSVSYATVDATATAAEDYIATSAALRFDPGEVSKVITLVVLGDADQEANETVAVVLSNPRNAVLGTAEASLTIVNDDDGGVSLSIDDVAVSEGNSGSKALSFTISLSGPSAQSVSVDYATIDDTATAGGLSATGGADYFSTSDSITFAPGETFKQVDVTINGDSLNESDEQLTIELFNGVNALVVDPQGVGTIGNDDASPVLSVADVSVTEGAAGVRMATFQVSLSKSSGRPVTVAYSTSNGTASAAQDYVSTTGTLTFDPGETSALVSVAVNGDLLNEADETFFVNLSSAVNAIVNDSQAQGTVSNDDPLPSLVVDDVSLVEGDAGAQNAVFSVSLSAPSGRDVSVGWSTGTGTATAGQDYVAASGSLSFAAGDSVRTISVIVNGDTQDELNETFGVELSGALNALLGDQHGTGTIITDDSTLPGLDIVDASVGEGNAGTVTLSLSVTLTASSAQSVSVNYATSNGSASSGLDYQTTSGTLTFDPGQISKVVEIPVAGDTLDEPDETVFVTLSDPINAFVADGGGIGTISDDDAAPTLSVSDVTLVEGNSGTKNATFTVSLSTSSGFTVGVSFATLDGSALEGGSALTGQDDYDAASSTLLFAPGETSKTVDVLVNGDVLPEANETFSLQLSSPSNATVSDGQGLCTVSNDDASPTISIDDVSALEGDAGTKVFTFTVTLSKPNGSQVSVDFSTANGTALSPSDYTAASGTVLFAPGETVRTVEITVIGESAAEAHKDETFYVNLTNAQGATISDTQGVGTISSDD
jgi:large repetitive protein